MKPVPNTILPAGAKAIRPRKVKVGEWIEMTVDATLVRNGVTWYRVQGGFGDGRHPREDWVAALPHVAVSVSDYHWNGDSFGPDYGTIENAMDAQLKQGIQTMLHSVAELRRKARELEKALGLLPLEVQS